MWSISNEAQLHSQPLTEEDTRQRHMYRCLISVRRQTEGVWMLKYCWDDSWRTPSAFNTYEVPTASLALKFG